jgi:hypothetical protein
MAARLIRLAGRGGVVLIFFGAVEAAFLLCKSALYIEGG